MNLLFALVSSINRFRLSRRLFGWLIGIIVLLQSVVMWIRKNEFEKFSDCLFHFQKQSKHPWTNERAVEYPWIYKNISKITGGTVLDVGAREGLPSTDLLLENNNLVYTIDINASPLNKSNPKLNIDRGDIRKTKFKDAFFDAVIAVSTLEHVGLPGRYGITEADDKGDLRAMQEIHRILKPDGQVFVTLPYGGGKSRLLNRLYDEERIIELFSGFDLQIRQYFKYDATYELWFEVPESIAANNNWDVDPWYSLACFCGRKNPKNKPRQLE